MNTYIVIKYIDELNTFRVGDVVQVDVYPLKNISYYAEQDFSIKIFLLDEQAQSWIEVENAGIALDPSGRIYLEGEKGMLDFYPKLENDIHSAHLFYCIYGNIIKGGSITDEQIGASSEITLAPATDLN